MKSLSFAAALAPYPAYIKALVAESGISTNLALWILGDKIEWDYELLPSVDPRRLSFDDSMQLTRANWHLAGNDDLPGLLEEFQKRIGASVRVGDLIAFDRTEGWSRSWGDLAPQGRLVVRGPDHPFMAIPLAIEVKPMHVFPAWTLTRKTGVRLA